MVITEARPGNLGWFWVSKILLATTFFVFDALEANALAGSKEPKPILIEVGDLQKILKKPELRILDTRPQADYAKGHIPGAIRVDVKDWQALGKKEGGFRDAKAWGELVGQLGITHESKVAVYGSNLTDTARVWWTLKYVGVKDVMIVNGGWNAWSNENLPLEKTIASTKATTFEPKFDSDRLEEIDPLKKAIKAGRVKVVDARSQDEFTGKEVKGKKVGHIAGATHLEWKELLAEDGRFKTPERLRKLFRERGIVPDDTAVCY
jgi:thiosulfate/3-mercaptopyruvate sulfurtransferase